MDAAFTSFWILMGFIGLLGVANSAWELIARMMDAKREDN